MVARRCQTVAQTVVATTLAYLPYTFPESGLMSAADVAGPPHLHISQPAACRLLMSSSREAVINFDWLFNTTARTRRVQACHSFPFRAVHHQITRSPDHPITSRPDRSLFHLRLFLFLLPFSFFPVLIR